MHINTAIREEPQEDIDPDSDTVIWLDKAFTFFVKVMRVGQYCFDIGIIVVKSDPCDDFECCFGMSADWSVDGIAIVKIFVDICKPSVRVIVGVDEHETDAESEFEEE